MNPGDVIEWTYNANKHLVRGNETAWSSMEGRYVPIGSSMVHFLVSVEKNSISWLNENGLFRAHVTDDGRYRLDTCIGMAVPRKCKIDP